MRTPIHYSIIIAILASLPVLAQEPASQADHVIFQQGDGEVVIKIDDKPIATYVYEDSEIPRPLLCACENT